jgi:hypothetical protein
VFTPPKKNTLTRTIPRSGLDSYGLIYNKASCGSEIDSAYNTIIYRAVFEFDLSSIPSYVEIVRVVIQGITFYGSTQPFLVSIKKVPDSYSEFFLKATWDSISQSMSYYDNLNTSYYYNIDVPQLITEIQEKVDARKDTLRIAFVSMDESQLKKTEDISISRIIVFSVVKKYTHNIKNAFKMDNTSLDGYFKINRLYHPLNLPTYPYTPGQYPSPYAFNLYAGTEYELEGVDQLFYDPIKKKYYQGVFDSIWIVNEDIKLPNKSIITVKKGKNLDIQLNFLRLFVDTFKVWSYEDGLGVGGTIKVNDVDKGNQFIETIKEGSTIRIEAVPSNGYVFVQWSDGVKNARRDFKPTDHATIYAKFKKKFSSNYQYVFKNNNQRKIKRDAQGVYHLVYESAGDIWYTKSTDGYTWSGEELVSQGVGGCKNPSIDVDEFGNLHVVWFMAFGQGGDIFYRKKNSSGWSNISCVSWTFRGFVKQSSTPVITLSRNSYYPGQHNVWIAWNDIDGIYITSDALYDEPGLADGYNELGWGIFYVPGTSSGSNSPSVASSDMNLIHLAWEDGQIINYIMINANAYGVPVLSYRNTISYGLGYSYNFAPSISEYNFQYSAVSWLGAQNYSAPLGIINRLQTNWPSWSGFYVWLFGFPSSYNGPVLTTYNPDVNLGMVFSMGTSMYFTRFSNGSWASPYSIGTGLDPIIGAGIYSNFPQSKIIYRVQNSQYLGQYYGWPSKISPVDFKRFRRVVLHRDSVEFAFEVGDLDGKIEFEPLVIDTIPDYQKFLKTRIFKAGGALRLKKSLNVVGNPGEKRSVKFFLDFVDAKSKSKIEGVSFELNSAKLLDTNSITIDMNKIKDKEIFIEIRWETSGLDSYKVNLAEVFVIDSLQKQIYSEPPAETSELPEKFELYQNYPNPFNPITKIKFSLPEDSYVEIKVYDVLGREIVTLLSENRKAGYHEITFDASNLPSGVYFYRIKAGKFADVKKMILMK